MVVWNQPQAKISQDPISKQTNKQKTHHKTRLAV
jgi:hypothetical protein